MNPPLKWLGIFGVVALSAIAVAALAVAVYAGFLFHEMPDAADLADYRPPTATRAYAVDGTLIGEFSNERRIFVPYDRIPAQLAQAFLAAEDRNFFRHGGVDLGGLTRAMVKNVGNAVQGRRFEGGSTITQQVAKNVLLSNEATLGRKAKEAILAGRLEQTLTKEQILELYLNEIWLGYRSYGVGAAAYNYFGKPISDLNLAECAYLAALPKGPQNYHPIKQKRAGIYRRNLILEQMADLGWITRAEADAAKATDLKVQTEPSRAKYKDADYFVEEARRRGRSILGDRLNEGGYYMRTTLDPRLQTAAQNALMDGLEAYDRRHGWRGAWAKLENTDGWEAVAKRKKRPAERRDWTAALVTEVQGDTVQIKLPGEGGTGQLVGADVAWARAGKGLFAGDLIFVAPSSKGGFNLKQIPAVNGALVAMEPHSGRVLAMVGGYSFSLSNFNRATQALRQPGSAFKPIVYAAALENGFTPASVVMDSPIRLAGGKDGEVWSPENYSHNYLGALVLRRGLELSRNTMTVRLAQGTGMRTVVDLATRIGVVDKMEPVLAMALGAGETTPFRLTGAYASFVNGGRKVEPHLIELVQDREGKTIYKADKRDCPRCDVSFNGDESPRVPAAGAQMFDPITAYQVTSMLEGVVQRGTAVSVSSLGRPLGGKTGTTNEYRSAWFEGFSPQLVVGVFVGFDDNRSLGQGETGTQAAVPIFISFMREATKGVPPTPFKAPTNAKFVMVRGVREAFRPGTEPKLEVPVITAGSGASSRDGISQYRRVGTPGAPGGPAAPAATAPAKKSDDLTGLY